MEIAEVTSIGLDVLEAWKSLDFGSILQIFL